MKQGFWAERGTRGSQQQDLCTKGNTIIEESENDERDDEESSTESSSDDGVGGSTYFSWQMVNEEISYNYEYDESDHKDWNEQYKENIDILNKKEEDKVVVKKEERISEEKNDVVKIMINDEEKRASWDGTQHLSPVCDTTGQSLSVGVPPPRRKSSMKSNKPLSPEETKYKKERRLTFGDAPIDVVASAEKIKAEQEEEKKKLEDERLFKEKQKFIEEQEKAKREDDQKRLQEERRKRVSEERLAQKKAQEAERQRKSEERLRIRLAEEKESARLKQERAKQRMEDEGERKKRTEEFKQKRDREENEKNGIERKSDDVARQKNTNEVTKLNRKEENTRLKRPDEADMQKKSEDELRQIKYPESDKQRKPIDKDRPKIYNEEDGQKTVNNVQSQPQVSQEECRRKMEEDGRKRRTNIEARRKKAEEEAKQRKAEKEGYSFSTELQTKTETNYHNINSHVPKNEVRYGIDKETRTIKNKDRHRITETEEKKRKNEEGSKQMNIEEKARFEKLEEKPEKRKEKEARQNKIAEEGKQKELEEIAVSRKSDEERLMKERENNLLEIARLKAKLEQMEITGKDEVKQLSIDTPPDSPTQEDGGPPRVRHRLKRAQSSTSQVRASELIYEMVKSPNGRVNKNKFMDELAVRGILPDDPRISKLYELFEQQGGWELEKQIFIERIFKDVHVIERAFANTYVIPFFETFTDKIRSIYNECTNIRTGKMSVNIPQLGKQNPNCFGVSICTVDGQRMSIGHTDVDFCIQSCAKPISYCLALEEHQMNVHKYVGREPSGERFNALKLMDNGLPHNPLVNAGAIMICSLIKKAMEPADKFDAVTQTWADLAGGFPFAFSNPAYLSARNSSDRDFAIAHFLKEKNIFPQDVDMAQVLEFYFQCGALSTNTNHLSIVASSLANGGVCPITGKVIFSPETVKNCLSMMYSCGMYEYSGEFAFTVGLPASSGEAGAIMVVIPNVMGICTFSPLLDEFGNSTRGVAFFSKFIESFSFHSFDNVDETYDKEDPRKGNTAEEITVEKIIKYSSLGDLGALKRLRPNLDDLLLADYDRRTPLHLAASNGHADVVEFLLEEIGADNVNPIDRWSGSPYDDAMREEHFDVANILKQFGGMRGTDVVAVKCC